MTMFPTSNVKVICDHRHPVEYHWRRSEYNGVAMYTVCSKCGAEVTF
jgi:hypothetical protein